MKKVKVNYIKIASENMYYVNRHIKKARKQFLQAGLVKNLSSGSRPICQLKLYQRIIDMKNIKPVIKEKPSNRRN